MSGEEAVCLPTTGMPPHSLSDGTQSFLQQLCSRAWFAGTRIADSGSLFMREGRACLVQEKRFFPAWGTRKASWKRRHWSWVLKAGQNLNARSEWGKEVPGSEWGREKLSHCDKEVGSNKTQTRPQGP